MRILFFIIFQFVVFVPIKLWATPCQLCAANYSKEHPRTATQDYEETTFNIDAGLQLQYEYRTKLYNEGDKVENVEKNQIATTKINLYGGWAFAPGAVLDFSLPVISRVHAYGTFSDRTDTRETGIGDALIVFRGFPVYNRSENSDFRISLRGGASIPTGEDEDLKQEELGTLSTAIRGSELSRGSGTVNYVLGTNIYWLYERWQSTLDLQYWLNTEGSYDFQYGNQLWVVGNTAYALSPDQDRFLLGVNFIYRQFAKDQLDGQELDDSGSALVFVGPSISFDMADRFNLIASYNLPVAVDNNGTQLLEDYLLQVSAIAKF